MRIEQKIRRAKASMFLHLVGDNSHWQNTEDKTGDEDKE